MPEGRAEQVTLGMYAGSDFAAGKPPVMSFILENAWCAKIDIEGAKAGAGDIVYETVQIVCDKIMPGAS